MPLFPIDYCRFLKSLLTHSKYFVKEETTLVDAKVMIIHHSTKY